VGGPRSRAGLLVRELLKHSPEFAALWDRHEVATRFEDHKTLLHPTVGSIELDWQALLTEDQSQALIVFTAAPRTEAAEKLDLLRVLGEEQFALWRLYRSVRRRPGRRR
jgi:MmyB-like transcription regulator ligand binding domain